MDAIQLYNSHTYKYMGAVECEAATPSGRHVAVVIALNALMAQAETTRIQIQRICARMCVSCCLMR